MDGHCDGGRESWGGGHTEGRRPGQVRGSSGSCSSEMGRRAGCCDWSEAFRPIPGQNTTIQGACAGTPYEGVLDRPQMHRGVQVNSSVWSSYIRTSLGKPSPSPGPAQRLENLGRLGKKAVGHPMGSPCRPGVKPGAQKLKQIKCP